MKTNDPQSPFDIIRAHRADFAGALDAALHRKKQAEIEIERCSGGLAALDLLLPKLTSLPADAQQSAGQTPGGQ